MTDPSNANTSGLSPCPFCGGEAEMFSISDRVGVRCADVMCAGSHRLPLAGEDAVGMWNRRAAPASPLPGGGWQDISTAPKDGTPILITRPTRFMSEEGYHVVRWDDEQWCCHDGKFDTWLRGSDPTHWMPLPAAPTGDPK